MTFAIGSLDSGVGCVQEMLSEFPEHVSSYVRCRLGEFGPYDDTQLRSIFSEKLGALQPS